MKRKKFEWTGRLILIIFSLILVLSLIFFITKQTHKNTTEQLLTEYMNYINPILLISMVEDVKNIGGSGYVVQKDKRVLDQYLR